jgi:hypothetical protein
VKRQRIPFIVVVAARSMGGHSTADIIALETRIHLVGFI